jgi:hypothetical protein
VRIKKIKSMSKKYLPKCYRELKLTVEDDTYALSWGARYGAQVVLKYKMVTGWNYIVEVKGV